MRTAAFSFASLSDLPWNKSSYPQESALPDADFALVCHTDSGGVLRALPGASTEDLIKSSAVLAVLADKLPEPVTAHAVAQIRRLAKESGVELPEQFQSVNTSAPAAGAEILIWDSAWERGVKSSQIDRPFTVRVPGNPLAGQSEVNFSVRTTQDLEEFQEWAEQNGPKLSSVQQHFVGQALLRGLEAEGLYPGSPGYEKRAYDIKKAVYRTDRVRGDWRFHLSRVQPLPKLSEKPSDALLNARRAYATIVDKASSAKEMSLSEAKEAAFLLSCLSKFSGVPDVAMGVFFEDCTCPPRAPEDPQVVWVDGRVIRKSDLLRVRNNTQMKNVAERFSDIDGQPWLTVWASDPVKAFNSLGPEMQRILGRLVLEHSQGIYRSTGIRIR